MSSAQNSFSPYGVAPTEEDLENLLKRFITPEGAEEAGIRRVDSITGAALFNRKSKNLAGLIIPYVLPGENGVREYRLRLDVPELVQNIDGSISEKNRYIQPSDRKLLAYFPPGVPPELLQDVTVPVLITVGAFKALALWRLARHETQSPRFLPLAFSSVWDWRGTIGTIVGPNGKRQQVQGVIPDVDRILWKGGRRVVIAFDAEPEQNSGAMAASGSLTTALIERGAVVGTLEWPASEGDGIDDRLAAVGPERVLTHIATVEFGSWYTRLLRDSDGKILSCYENVALFLEHSPVWAGVLGYNEFTGGHFVLSGGPEIQSQ